MKTTGTIVVAVLAGFFLIGAGPAGAQAPGQYGARVGNTYLPSSHDANCSGLICSSVPVDPARPSQALPPPPCEGLICSLTPYSMQPPYTAAQAAAVERQRAAAAAAAAAPPPEPAPPIRHARTHRKKVRAAAATTPRTPAPAAPAR